MKDICKLPGGVFEIKVYKNKEARLRGDKPIKKIKSHNQMTNASLAVISGLIGNTGAQTAFTYLAVGTSSTATSASHTALQGEISDSGLARAAATVSRTTSVSPAVTNDTLSLLHEWTVSGTKTIEEAGIFNAASVGTMLARALTGSIAVISGNHIQITYTFKVVGN